MKPIPTAEELFSQRPEYAHLAIEFAKMHVEAALKRAHEKASIKFNQDKGTLIVEEDSIVNAYPLTNIK